MINIESNIDELIEKFKKLQSEVGAIDFSSALLVGVNAAMGKMTYRIFNLGQDASGLDFGKYTGKRSGINKRTAARLEKLNIAQDLDIETGLTAYEKKRLKAGRQISYKDLEFTGDLRRAIVVGVESNTRVICWIPNDQEYKIAKYQEQQIAEIQGASEPVKIFALSKDEEELMAENIIEALKQIYDRIFNNQSDNK